MKTVFLTGATGTMGSAGLRELLAHSGEFGYRIKVLVLPGRDQTRRIRPYKDRVEVIRGDLRCYEDVLAGVTGSDIVLHVGGMVSPKADYKPVTTRDTNVGAARNIHDAVVAQGDRQPAVVYIGSVAQMGDRREPLHWGRAGDPLCASAYDHYGLTKIMAERILTGGGIRRWVSLRQSGILYPGILRNFDPIMFHVPLRGVLEWATVEDSGRLLERVCRPDVPEGFWNNYYNISSGPSFRLSNYDFDCLMMDAVGCPRPERIYRPKWFATRNFHGMWYTDSDRLEEMLHFRAGIPAGEYFARMAGSPDTPFALKAAAATKAARLAPHMVKLAMAWLANRPVHGTQAWIRKDDRKRIAAHYGSREAYEAIPEWKDFDLSPAPAEPVLLSHGYDESKPMEAFTIEDMRSAAAFRGGKCLSAAMEGWDGDLEWECAQGHRFKATPRQVLLGGHWCMECFPYPWGEHSRPWHWDAEARRNPFFAQIWKPLHDPSEDNVYDSGIFQGWE